MQVKLVLAEQSDKEEEHDAQLLRRLSTRQTSSAVFFFNFLKKKGVGGVGG